VARNMHENFASEGLGPTRPDWAFSLKLGRRKYPAATVIFLL
jgi:hypothetical protein